VKSKSWIVALGCGLVALAAYVATASRTITWWEGSSYPLAAWTLGVPAPPGSLLLTLLGWVAARIPIVSPVAFRLNLCAGLLAAATVALVTWLSIRLATPDDRRPAAAELLGGAIAGLAFAFALSVWGHAVRFTPYILTATFTALILAAALAWWRRAESGEATARLFVLFLLFGLDFSVHRTNALLLPAALAWVTLRRPAGWALPARWGAILGGLALGLSVHLLLMPIAMRHPPFMQGDPSTPSGLWSYVSLQQFGGGFLFRIFPRTANFFSVQLLDYANFLRLNLAPSPLGILPVVLVGIGLNAGFRASPRRTLGLVGFVLCASLGAVVYFNLRANYFRAMDRHYLPSLVLIVPWMAVGIATLLRRPWSEPWGVRPALAGGLALLFLAIPWNAWNANHAACDLSRVRFAETYSRDVLEPLPPDAILLTNGDNDSFPLWYLQVVEHVRPDVTVVNLPLTNMAPYVAQLRRSDPRLAGLAAGPDVSGYVDVGSATVAFTVDDSLVRIPFSGMHLGQDVVVASLLELAADRRPICVACTVPPDNLPWLFPHLRVEGMFYRLVPNPAVQDVPALRHRLLEVVRYTDVADTSVAMDADSRGLCRNYVAGLFQLAQAQLAAGDAEGCLATLQFADTRTPLGRLELDKDMFKDLRKLADRLR
jgi:hypothetical protein